MTPADATAPRRAVRAPVAVASGLALAFSFEPYGLPVLLPVGVAGLVWSLHRTTARSGAWIGLLGGAAFMFVHLFWMRSVGYDAWLMLSLLETSFFAAFGAAVAVLSRLRAWPVWTAMAWVTVELWRGGWPFGGMPWGRLAYGTADTPFAAALPYVGSTGVGLLIALVGTSLAWAVLGGRHRPRAVLAVVAGLVVATALPVLLPYDAPETGSATVAAVQGDVPGDGTDILFDHRGVTRNHVDVTVRLADDVAGGTVPQPDFVVWPENSTAVDPFLDEPLNASIRDAVAAVGVPILVGAIVEDPEPGKILNQGIVWNPGTGAADRYSKRHPVPFGEYIPWRDSNPLTDRFDELARVARDMQAGTRVDPMSIAGVEVADAICFDIAYDDGIYAQVLRGAELLVVQTSNATFIETSQIDQQFEITRVRARETGRDVVVAATNGVAGVIAADGSVVDRLEPQTQGYVVERVSLTDEVPPAIRLGPALGWVALVVALAALVAAAAVPYRRRRGGRPGRDARARPRDQVSNDGLGRAVMVVPTYNEAENLEWIVGRMRVAEPEVDVLVVDDGSPDGTGAIADRLAAADAGVRVVHRAEKAGLGAAYLHGFAVALEGGYDVIGEMDADGSHQPEQLHRLLSALHHADLVIGSRWVPGGSVVDWPFSRRALSRGGNLYVRLLLGLPVRDATAGFRLFRRTTFEKIELASVRSNGYVFQTDLAYRTVQAGLRVVEVPIEFIERVRGDSKMSGAVARESLQKITVWGLRERVRRLRRGLTGARR